MPEAALLSFLSARVGGSLLLGCSVCFQLVGQRVNGAFELLYLVLNGEYSVLGLVYERRDRFRKRFDDRFGVHCWIGDFDHRVSEINGYLTEIRYHDDPRAPMRNERPKIDLISVGSDIGVPSIMQAKVRVGVRTGATVNETAHSRFGLCTESRTSMLVATYTVAM